MSQTHPFFVGEFPSSDRADYCRGAPARSATTALRRYGMHLQNVVAVAKSSTEICQAAISRLLACALELAAVPCTTCTLRGGGQWCPAFFPADECAHLCQHYPGSCINVTCLWFQQRVFNQLQPSPLSCMIPCQSAAYQSALLHLSAESTLMPACPGSTTCIQQRHH